MSERLIHLCTFAGPVVEYGGYRFEFSERFGPLLLNKDDTPKKDQPVSERDPFWRIFDRWQSEGGYRTDPTAGVMP